MKKLHGYQQLAGPRAEEYELSLDCLFRDEFSKTLQGDLIIFFQQEFLGIIDGPNFHPFTSSQANTLNQELLAAWHQYCAGR